MMRSDHLEEIADHFETEAGIITPANPTTDTGRWKRIAAAVEALANIATPANVGDTGYMLRTAEALEALKNISTPANAGDNGYLLRIVTALEDGTATAGSLRQRFLNAALTFAGVSPEFLTYVLATTGQSNAERFATTSGAPALFTSTMAGLDTRKPWEVIDASADGSALLYESVTQPSDNWWYNPDTSEYGPRLIESISAIGSAVAAGKKVKYLYHNQGEAEAFQISANSTRRTKWKTNWPIVWDILIAATGNPDCKVLLVPMNRRDTFDGSITADYQNGMTIIRRWLVEIAAANPSKYVLAPEMYDGPGDGGAHRTPQGYLDLIPRMARKTASLEGLTVSGGVDGPVISAAQFDGTAATATITHDGGTDITPSTGIQGFTATDGSGDLPIGAAVRGTATRVDITFGRAPVAPVTLEYGKGTLFALGNNTAYLDMLRDNQTEPLPLRFAEVVMTDNTVIPEPEANASSVWANTVFDLDAAGTSGQTVPNLVESPADGSAQTAYDFFLGSTSGTGEGNEPTLIAASGGDPAYLQSDGNDVIQQTAQTTFMRNLANDRSMTLSLLIKAPSTWGSVVTYLFTSGARTASIPGFSIRYVAGSTQLRISSSDGSSLENGMVTLDAGLPTSGYFMLSISYVGSTGAYQVWLNGTLAKSGTISNRKTGVTDLSEGFNVGNNLPSSAGLVAAAMSNEVKDTTAVAALRDFYATKFGVALT